MIRGLWKVQSRSKRNTAMVAPPELDEAVRQTDFDALSSRLSCFLKGYNPEDRLLLTLVPLLLHYQLAACPSEFKRYALARRLRSQFFNVFPANLSEVSKLVQQDACSQITAKINRFTPLKPPMINRGTYLRTAALSKNIAQFISEHSHLPTIQIVSLGAGNDTRAFSLVPQHENLHYFELDFEFTVKLKKLAILSAKQLSSPLGLTPLPLGDLPASPDQITAFDPTLHAERYHLIPYDLRTLKPGTSLEALSALAAINPHVPTLIISECCICYLSKEDSNNVISFWRDNLDYGRFLVYEPLGGADESEENSPEGANTRRFGEVMVKNLICRGIEMPTLLIYGTVDAQIERFRSLIDTDSDHYKCHVWCKDMKWVYDNEIDCSEIDRISRLEMLDEMEELNLINSHYCLIIAKWELR